MNLNEHEKRLSNITLVDEKFLVSKNMDVNEHDTL